MLSNILFYHFKYLVDRNCSTSSPTVGEVIKVKIYHVPVSVFFLARKSDQWIAVDPTTGIKLHTFTPDGVQGTCPILTSPSGALYIGRSGKDFTMRVCIVPLCVEACGSTRLLCVCACVQVCTWVSVCVVLCTF